MSPLILIAVVVLVAWWTWSLWGDAFWDRSIPAGVRQWQKKINDHLPSRRGPVIEEARAWSQEKQREVADRSERAERDAGTAADAEALREIADDAHGMGPFSMVVGPVDWFVQWALCTLTMTQFSAVENLAFGAAIACGIWGAAYYALRLWDRRSTPRRSVRIAKTIAMWSFAVAALGGVIYLAARYAAPAFFVGHEDVVLVSLIALAELLPVAGAAASFGANVARRAAAAAENSGKLRKHASALVEFDAWLDEHDPTAAPPDDPKTPHLVEEVAHA